MLIRENDEVIVITGENRGAKGKVLRVNRDANTVVIEGVNKVYKHVKRSAKNPQGGRLHKEMPIAASNVMLLCPETKKRTRVGVRYLKDGSKERFAKKSGVSLGSISPAKKRYAQG
ncbi:MAG: 50S ribosomal protein L24 [Planctomycetales bacterium]|nr:50S ribosomal protein L24 [Planctomycetales bacterium]